MNNKQKTPVVETHHFADDGTVPNSRLPLVVYRGALADDGDRAGACEEMFARNGWPDSWRNGIYPYHHYHSTAHEVLGIARGHARVRLGGENGASVELRAGDVSFAGIVKRVNLAYVPEARIGDHVMVHVGFAISVVDEIEARNTLEYLQQMGELAELEP